MEETITLNLSVEQCNIILASLAKGPFEVVADLIVEIKKQAEAQLTSPQQDTYEAD